jgi:crotonobetainyl-CoA:carnitine CoA-transferase CaiB-like acyl-CoA transferase
MTAPLAGIKVLDITANMSGPFGTMILGDQGADVIKLEPPGGDPIRNLGTGTDGLTAYYANLNRSKRSVVLDLELAESRPVFERLLDWADVVVHNYRPAAAKSLRIDDESVRATRRTSSTSRSWASARPDRRPAIPPTTT